MDRWNCQGRVVMGILGLVEMSRTSCDGDSGIYGTVKDEL